MNITEREGAVTFAVRVQPRAKQNSVLGELGEALKIGLTAPPLEGRANQACIDFLAELLGVSRSAIRIVSGASSRNKVVRVAGVSAAQLRQSLGL